MDHRCRPHGMLVAALLGLVAGCGRESNEPADTGARQAARDFYEALIRKDWKKAHAALHPQSGQYVSLQEFASLAEAYRGQLGFEPDEVHIRACEERGAEATAHVTLSGRGEKQTHRYRDGIVLRQDSNRWRVILPDPFGKAK